MSNNDDGGSAFPSPAIDTYWTKSSGMTLRDYFAAAALQGLLSTPLAVDGEQLDNRKSNHLRGISEVSYQLADAMLEARKAVSDE